MKKHLVILASFLAPVCALAANPATTPVVNTTSAAASAAMARDAVRESKWRGTAMGACQQKAAEQKLEGFPRKQFIANCVKAK
jgi:hypothetical protein